MKFLFVVAHPNHHIGGAEIQAYRIAIHLKSNNHDIEYLMAWNDNIEPVSDENGIIINYFKRGGPLKFLSIYNSYVKIKNIKPDVIYIRGVPFAWASAVFFSRKAKNVQSIWQCPSGRSLIKFSNIKELLKTYNFLSIIYNFYESLLLDIIQLYTIRNSHKIIAQTDNNREYLLKNYKRDSTKILKGIEWTNHSINKEYNEKIRIYYIRNIKPRSRLELFLEVANKIINSTEKKYFEFHIIGQNQSNFDFSNINPNIIYHGKLENKIVYKYLSNAHILIDTLYELNEQTTYSTTFIEAWANGVIILSFDTNPDDVLTSKNIGYRVISSDDCVEKILSFQKNRKKLIDFSFRTYEYAKENHNIHQEVEQILNIVDNEKKI